MFFVLIVNLENKCCQCLLTNFNFISDFDESGQHDGVKLNISLGEEPLYKNDLCWNRYEV